MQGPSLIKNYANAEFKNRVRRVPCYTISIRKRVEWKTSVMGTDQHVMRERNSCPPHAMIVLII